LTTDVGQHQMWVAQMYPFTEPRTLLTSGGLGTMGFGIPAAIGAALARPDRRVVCVTGDGSLLMNLQELATLAELSSRLTVVVLNNGHLGLVRQQQELFYGERYHASRFHAEPDFATIARGFGIRAFDLASGRDGDEPALVRALHDESGPTLINIAIPASENVLPIVPPGAANRDMVTRGPDRPRISAP
jgi:acetolactate synthase-1/2/3 large subunit